MILLLASVSLTVAVVQLTECQVAGYLRARTCELVFGVQRCANVVDNDHGRFTNNLPCTDGFAESDVPKLTCASFYESSRECSAQGPPNSDGSVDYGILQVNSRYWCSGGPESGADGCGVACSAIIASCDSGFACAKIVYNAQGVDAWYGYTGHKSTCDEYQLPSSCAAAGSGSGNAVPSGPSAATPCAFKQTNGVCSYQSDCMAVGKAWTSSNNGASGCESEPDDVECCTNPVAGNGVSQNSDSSSIVGNNPPCSYRSAPGMCVSSCSGGQFRSSRQGAHGCESYAAAVKCCVSSSNLVNDVYSGYESSSGSTAPQLALIIGVVIGVVLLLAIVVGVAVYFIIIRRRNGPHSDIAYSNPTFSTIAAPAENK